MHACMHARTHACMHTYCACILCMQACIHACILCTHACMHIVHIMYSMHACTLCMHLLRSFVNMLINDSIYSMDEALTKIGHIRETQALLLIPCPPHVPSSHPAHPVSPPHTLPTSCSLLTPCPPHVPSLLAILRNAHASAGAFAPAGPDLKAARPALEAAGP